MKKIILMLFIIAVNFVYCAKEEVNLDSIPDSPSDLYRTSQEELGKNQYNAAINNINAIVAKDPGNIASHMALARAYIKAGDVRSGYKEYEKAMSLGGTSNPDVVFEYGDFCFRDKMYEKAMHVFMRDKTGNYKNDFGAAVCARFLGNYERAETYYKRVIAKNSSVSEAYLGLAITYQLKQDYDSATLNFEKYLLRKRSEEVYVVLASIYINKKDYANAKRVIEKGAQDYPASDKIKKISQELYK